MAPVHRPEGFNLATAWESTVAQVEEQLALVTAVVRIPAMALPWLRELFGRRLSVRKDPAGGRIEVEVAGASAEQIAQLVAGWGRDLEVVSPAAVRDHLSRIGAELVGQNSSGASP